MIKRKKKMVTFPYITIDGDMIVVYQTKVIETKLDLLEFDDDVRKFQNKSYPVMTKALTRATLELLRKLISEKNFMYWTSPLVWNYLEPTVKISRDDALWFKCLETDSFVEETLQEANYKFLRNPYFHQKQAFITGLGFDKISLMYDMGLGKTFISLAIADYLLTIGEISRVLVIAPKALLYDWKNEADEFTHQLSPLIHSADTGLQNCPKANLDITNYDFIWRRMEHFQAFQYDLIILDEAHNVQNPSAKRSKAIRRLSRKIKRMLQLTGTPQSNSVKNLIGQMLLLDGGEALGDWEGEFNKRFCWNTSKKGFPTWALKDGSLDEIIERISPYSIRRSKEECLDLPTRIPIPHRFPLTKKNWKLYEEEVLAMSNPDSPFVSTSRLGKLESLLSLAKVCNGWTGSPKSPCDLPVQEKISLVLELVQNLGEDEKFIVWTKFQHDCELVLEALKKSKIGAVGFFGAMNTNQMETSKTKFKTDPSCRGFVATIKKGGTGLNLTEATHAIYFSLETSYREIAQSMDRNYRIGQEKKVTVHFLIAERTVDEGLYQNYLQKGNLFDRVINNLEVSQSSAFDLLHGGNNE